MADAGMPAAGRRVYGRPGSPLTPWRPARRAGHDSPDGLPPQAAVVFPLPLPLAAVVPAGARYPGDEGRVGRMSLIQEDPERRVRMANLAVAGSFAVNGVAGLQSRLLAATTLRDFADLWPEKFLNVTNGVSPRRTMMRSLSGSAGSCWRRLRWAGWRCRSVRCRVILPVQYHLDSRRLAVCLGHHGLPERALDETIIAFAADSTTR